MVQQLIYRLRTASRQSGTIAVVLATAYVLVSGVSVEGAIHAGAQGFIQNVLNDYKSELGEFSADAHVEGYRHSPGWNTESASASAFAGGTNTDHYLRTHVDVFVEVNRYSQRAVADAAWQDVILVAPPAGAGMPGAIQVRFAVDFDVTFNRLGSGGYGTAGADLMLYSNRAPASNFLPGSFSYSYGPPASISVFDNSYVAGIDPVWHAGVAAGAWNRYSWSTNDIQGQPSHFRGERVLTINYNPDVGGYEFYSLFRVMAEAGGVRVTVDGLNSASIVAITDIQGNSLQESGYHVSFLSGMTQASEASVPEPASIAIWSLTGLIAVGGVVRRVSQRRISSER